MTIVDKTIIFFICLSVYSCASTKFEIVDIYYKPKDKKNFIQSNEYHNEVITTNDISNVCSDIITNNSGPATKIIVELMPISKGRYRIINLSYSREDYEIAKCIEEVLNKYDFPELSIVNFRKKYEDGSFYTLSKVYKCNKNVNKHKFTYSFEPYSSDEFKRSLPIWDAFILSISSWASDCN